MKKSFLNITLLMLLATAVTTTSCTNSPANKEEKVENAQESLVKAKAELDQARADSIYEYNRFKEEAEAKFIENDRKIAELKERLVEERKETRAEYEKNVNALEEKNAKLRKRIEENKEGAKDKWDAFKLSVNQEIDELGKSISSMAEKNMKNKK
jgi:hypothetical protein